MNKFTCTEYSMGLLVIDDAQDIADKIGLNQRADLNKVKFQGSTLYCTDEEKSELIERGILSEQS